MPAPTFADFQQSTWTDLVSSSEVTASVTWQAADDVYVVGMTEDNGHTLGVPTASGLSFSQVTATNTASNCKVYLWKATAGSGSSGAITATVTGGSGMHGIAALVVRGSDGNGTPQTIVGSSAKTISVTRTQANSGVLAVFGDWNAVNDTTVDATPTGTVRIAANTANGTGFVLSWGDQGATGTTSYGLTNHTGSVKMAGIAVEIKGTTGGGGAVTVKNLAALGVG